MAARAEAMLARLALMMVRFGLMVGCWCCFGRMTDLRGDVAGFLKPTVLAGGTAGSMFGEEDETKREGKHSENSGTLSLSLASDG